MVELVQDVPGIQRVIGIEVGRWIATLAGVQDESQLSIHYTGRCERSRTRPVRAVAVALASPCSPMSGRVWPLNAAASASIWMTLRPAVADPKWVVHWLRLAPTATITSQCSSDRNARPSPSPPQTPALNGAPSTRPLASSVVSNGAASSSVSSQSAGPAPLATAPRPASIAGCRASARTDATGGGR
jgi:hypothetical protein